MFLIVMIGFLGPIAVLGVNRRNRFAREFTETVEKVDRIIRESHPSIRKAIGAEFLSEAEANPSWRAARAGEPAREPAAVVGEVGCGDRIIRGVERSWILVYVTPDPRSDFASGSSTRSERPTRLTVTVRKPQGLLGAPPETSITVEDRGSRIAERVLLERLPEVGIPVERTGGSGPRVGLRRRLLGVVLFQQLGELARCSEETRAHRMPTP
jgi:hypothetical protein